MLCDRDLSQGDTLDGGPNDRETTHLSGEHINLIGAFTNITKQALDGVSGADVAGHVQVLEPTRVRDQVTLVIAVAIAVAFGTAFSPANADSA